MKALVLAVGAAIAAMTFAQEPQGPHPARGPMMGMGAMQGDPLMFAVMNPRVANQIGLTDEQKEKLKELRGGAVGKELQEKVRVGMEKQMKLLEAEKIDEAAVMAAIDEVFEARKAIAKEQTKRLIAVKSVLTGEQIAKAREAVKEFRGKRGPKGPRGPKGNGPTPAGEAPEAK